jgi:hypothetical protein
MKLPSTKTKHPCGIREVVYDHKPEVSIFIKFVRRTKDFTEYLYTAYRNGEITECALGRHFHRLWIRGKDISMMAPIPPEFGVIPESVKARPHC